MIALTNSPDHALGTCTGHAKGHTAVFHVRTRDIQFNRRNPFERINTCCTLSIVIRRRAADVDNHIGVNILDLRIDVFAEVINALVLKAHTVEHAHRRLSHARIVVALTWMQSGSLHDDTAQLVERHKILKLKSIAEGARGRHHGILQLQILYLYV